MAVKAAAPDVYRECGEFASLATIQSVHAEFLIALEAQPDEPERAFLGVARFFRLHVSYAQSYEQVRRALANGCARNSALCAMLDKSRELSDGRDAESLLITPVQRVPRYALLLGELLKATPPSHPRRQRLETALALVRDVLTAVNEGKRDAENAAELCRLQSQCDDLPAGALVQPQRKLVRRGAVRVVAEGQEPVAGELLLLSDAVCVMARRRWPLSIVGSLGSPGGPRYTCRAMHGLMCMTAQACEGSDDGITLGFDGGAATLVVRVDTAKDRDRWVDDIRAAIARLSSIASPTCLSPKHT
eukprot:m51a1_g8539 putative rho guanine nucleotide exchange (303) ;mRNA; r:31489-32637